MVLVKDKVLMKAPRGKKPTRFAFVRKTKGGALRLGFKGREAVEVVRFKELKRRTPKRPKR